MNQADLMSSFVEADSAIVVVLCLLGILLPRLIKDEDIKYALHAILVAFFLGFLTNAIIFYILNK